MLLTVTALKYITILDPIPLEGIGKVTIQQAPGQVKVYDILPQQFYRLEEDLDDAVAGGFITYVTSGLPGGETYTNAAPTPVTIGGIDAGSTFVTQTMQQMWDALLYPYQDPTFSAFSISGQAATLEVGDSIPAAVTFVWGTTNPANIVPNSLDIRDVTGAVDLATGLADDGTEALVMGGPVQLLAQGSYVFRIRGTDTDVPAKLFNRNATYNWYWRFYWGTTATVPLVEAGIEALASNGLYGTIGRTYSFAASPAQYKYICYPAALGALTSFTDTGTGLNVPFEVPYTVNVTNTFAQTTSYNVYRSTNMLGGAMDIAVS